MENRFMITASSYIHSGLSVIPTTADKRPACPWKTFTTRMMSPHETETFFAHAAGIGIVCGKVSGNLELLDFDDRGSHFAPWFEKVPVYIKNRLVVETSPSGGRHVYFRVKEPVPGNRKLAMKADGHVLIETRGEGGYVKCAPSEGYVLTQGNFQNVPTLSPLEEQMLIEIAQSFDQSVKQVEKVGGGGDRGVGGGGERTLNSITHHSSLNTHTSPIDAMMLRSALINHGWKKIGESGENENWERPGKDEHSISATFNGDVFYVFSSNAMPFEPNKGYSVKQALRLLQVKVEGVGVEGVGKKSLNSTTHTSTLTTHTSSKDPGELPESLLHVPGLVDNLTEHTLKTAPYPNRPLAFAGALTMLAHLTGRNFRDERNLRTNIYLLALADSGVGKDFPRKVNMNLAAEIGIMPTMADRFASAEGLEDALLIHPTSFFQVDEIDTLFSSLNTKNDSSNEKIYGALLQFSTSSDTTYAMRKKAITTTGGKASKFDKVRARGIREPHLTMLGCAIPKYLYSALSERSLENGLLSRCLILEAGNRGKAGTPHFEPFSSEILDAARHLVSLGGFDGLDLEKLEDEPAPYVEPITITETDDAREVRASIIAKCEAFYDESKDTAAKALWTRGAEKTAKLALIYAISENPKDPLITKDALEWAWSVIEHLTRRMLYQASVYVHDNEFDALRQKAIRYLKDAPEKTLRHSALLKRLHIDADTFRRVIETMVQCESISPIQQPNGAILYKLID